MESSTPLIEQPESSSSGPAVTLGPRQITAVLVLAVCVAGLLCSLSYIAGRATARVETAAATPRPAPPLIVKSVTSPPAPVPLVGPATASGWMNVAPVPGATYFQLMSVEPGVAEVFAEGLHSEGFDAIAAAGASPAVHRVLVGPLKEGTVADIRARLEARGFHPFPRRYSTAEASVTESGPSAGSSAPKP